MTSTHREGLAAFGALDEKEKARFSLGTTPDGSAGFGLLDPQGNKRFELTTGPTGPQSFTYSTRRKSPLGANAAISPLPRKIRKRPSIASVSGSEGSGGGIREAASLPKRLRGSASPRTPDLRAMRPNPGSGISLLCRWLAELHLSKRRE